MAPGVALRDCYTHLGVPRYASEVEVKRAFHEQARLWHPDKCAAPGAAERFRKAREAFEILSSPRRRRVHDLSLGGLLGSVDKVATPCASRRSASATVRPTTPRSRCIAELLEALAAGNRAGPGNTKGMGLPALRCLSAECGVVWPLGSLERAKLLVELERNARALLDERVKQGAWSELHSKDIIVWLNVQGAALSEPFLQASKEQLVQLAKRYVAKGCNATDAGSRMTYGNQACGDRPRMQRGRKRRRSAETPFGRIYGPKRKDSKAQKLSPLKRYRRRAGGAPGSAQPEGGRREEELHAEASDTAPNPAVARLQELRARLEAHRLVGNGGDPAALPLLAEVLAADARGEVDRQALRLSKLGVELNGAWWKQCGGAAGCLATRLVARWKARCKAPPAAAAAAGPGGA